VKGDGGEGAASEGSGRGRRGGEDDGPVPATEGRGRRSTEACEAASTEVSPVDLREGGQRGVEGTAEAPGEGRSAGIGRGQRGEERRLRRLSRPARGEAAAVSLDKAGEGRSGGGGGHGHIL
jgi:hypothetical protein